MTSNYVYHLLVNLDHNRAPFSLQGVSETGTKSASRPV